MGLKGVLFEEEKGIQGFDWFFSCAATETEKTHLSFVAASGASPRELDAAAEAPELLVVVTVTPKRRSDCWTARSAMIL